MLIIAGFPRTIDRAIHFEEQVGKPMCCLKLEAPTEVLRQRLTARGRTDDSKKPAVEHRLQTWRDLTQEVEAHYDREEKLLCADADDELDLVFKRFEAVVLERLKREDKVEGKSY